MTILAFRSVGPQTSTALVLLHALPLDGTMWDGVLDHFATKGLPSRVIVVDAPGFGNSAPADVFAPGAEPSLDTYADALAALLDELGVTTVDLAGLSMGGSVAASFASRYPERVRGLALLDTSIGADTPEGRSARLANADRAASGNGYATVAQWTTTMLGPGTHQDVRDALDGKFRALPDASLAWIQRAMAARPDRREVVKSVAGPVWLVRGTHDPTCSKESFDYLKGLRPDAVMREIPGGGHFTANEAPELVGDILAEFVADAEASTPLP